MLSKYFMFFFFIILSFALSSCTVHVSEKKDCEIYVPKAYSKQYIESPEHADLYTCNRMGPFVIKGMQTSR